MASLFGLLYRLEDAGLDWHETCHIAILGAITIRDVTGGARRT